MFLSGPRYSKNLSQKEQSDWVCAVCQGILVYRGVAIFTQKRICIHIWTKNMGIFSHNSDGFLRLCVQNVCVEPILISLYAILTEFVMMLVSPPHMHPLMICHQRKVNEGLIIYMYNFNNLPLPRVCLSWQTAQTLMRCRILQHLIWVYTVCICSFFACIQPVPQVRTLSLRLAMPLVYHR